MRNQSARWQSGLLVTLAATILAAGGLPVEPVGSVSPERREVQASDPLERAAGTDFRVLTWNVFGLPNGHAPRDSSALVRVLAALDADVLLLNEVNGSAAEVEAVLPPPAQGAAPWKVHARGELVVAVRGGRSITGAFLRPTTAPATGFYPTLGELLFGRTRVTALGAFVSDGPRTTLVVPLHFPCCGDEAGRLRAAPALRDAVQAALAEASVDGVIVAGDFNTVNGRSTEPVEIVQRGVTFRGAPLAALEARQLDGQSNTTFWNPRRQVASRLDWLLFSDTTLELLRAFIFETEDLAPEWLRAHGLQADDSDVSQSSDHRPIVADFRWRR